MYRSFSDFDVWAFKRTENGWVWRRTAPDGQTVLQSGTGYETLEDCVVDAQRHGYLGSVRGLTDAI